MSSRRFRAGAAPLRKQKREDGFKPMVLRCNIIDIGAQKHRYWNLKA